MKPLLPIHGDIFFGENPLSSMNLIADLPSLCVSKLALINRSQYLIWNRANGLKRKLKTI